MSNSDPTLSPTKRALLALKDLQAKLDAMDQAQHEPIAIVGMGCRFPGGADTPEKFWTLLQQQTDAITEVPSDRWPLDTYHDPDPDAPGKMVSRYGGFVPHLYDFDAAFFRIAPREALALDPQQRLLLEVGWEALEHGGVAPDSLSGQPVGVFVGLSSIDHWQQLLAQHPDTINAYLATGNTHSVAAGRLSFSLGVTGPSLAIDAACASSLVAVHLACQSLRQQECDMALAGGVNRIITPETSINFSKARMLSTDGRCRTFDQQASGFGRAEGGGMIVLKRLRDAEAAGDRIHALILGSAFNHDGRTSGLTVPNGPAQQAVIQQALKASRVTPSAVSYIETHGTGTALGDPIEVGALAQVFGAASSETDDAAEVSGAGGQGDRDRPLILGAVKTNIGHLEAAAGIAGLIKATLALQHDTIPANLHLTTPNPHINWDTLPFTLPTTPIPWSALNLNDTPRIAGISAFGFNGTNAHVVIKGAEGEIKAEGKRQKAEVKAEDRRQKAESNSQPNPSGDALRTTNSPTSQLPNSLTPQLPNSPTPQLPNSPTPQNPKPHLLPLSARTPTALNQLVARYAQYLATHPQLDVADVCYTASVGRSHFPHRLVILAMSLMELRQILVDVLAGRPNPAYLKSDVESESPLSAQEELARRYVQGESVNWQQEYSHSTHRKVVLPTYPFQRQYYGPNA